MKRTLMWDVSRCTGRTGIYPEGKDCPERQTCARYLAFTEWDQDIATHQIISTTLGKENCEDKIEVGSTTRPVPRYQGV